MTKSSEINLLKAKTMLTPWMIAIEGQLRTTSLVILLALFCASLFFGAGYFILRRQINIVSTQKQSLITAIGKELQKEGLYTSFKDRLVIIGHIIDQQHSWLGVLDLIDRVTATGARTSFAVNENDEVSLSITNNTLEETFGVVDRILKEVTAKTIANPILESVQYKKDGSVSVSLTFIPIF